MTNPTQDSDEQLNRILLNYSLEVQELIANHTPFDDGAEASRYRQTAMNSLTAWRDQEVVKELEAILTRPGLNGSLILNRIAELKNGGTDQ